MQEMILAEDREARVRALDKLFPFQKSDFYGIFKEMEGYAVTIRTLDPPLHEFLPKTREEAEELSHKIGVPADRIWDKAQELHETNPDVRASRLPTRHQLSRDHRNAGARHHRRGLRDRQGGA